MHNRVEFCADVIAGDTTMAKMTNAFDAWKSRGSKEADWEEVAAEYNKRKKDGTLKQMSPESAGDAAMYMACGLKMTTKTISAYFGESPNWFSNLAHWYRLSNEARRFFSLVSYDPHSLALHDAQFVSWLDLEKQAAGAQNLLKDKQKKKIRARPDRERPV